MKSGSADLCNGPKEVKDLERVSKIVISLSGQSEESVLTGIATVMPDKSVFESVIPTVGMLNLSASSIMRLFSLGFSIHNKPGQRLKRN